MISKQTITTPSPKIRWAIFLTLALLALAVRLPQLGDRPMHTDEAINGYITGELLAGEKFHYDPQDRHGPVLYLLAKPVAQLCGAKDFAGLTETELRLTPAIIGSAMILLFGAAWEIFGFIPCLVAALLFAFAPLPVYYSRYFIHETLFVAATFGLMIAGWHTLKTNSAGLAALTGLCAALLLACKETAVIHFVSLAAAAFAGWLLNLKRAGAPNSDSAGDNNNPKPADLEIGAPSAKTAVMASVVFIIATILLFTWGGQNWAALTDLVRAVPSFATRAAGQGHEKPFGYYFEVLDPLFIFFLVGLAGIYAAICDAVSGTRKSSLPLVVYATLTFLIYSTIPYKTPWLALNLWLPLAILCGLGVEAIWLEVTGSTGRWIVAVAFAALMLTTGQQTKVFVFDKPIDEKNPYAYAHTTEDLLRLPPRLAELAKAANLTQPRIAVIAADAWPLPWYLRNFSQVGFWQPHQETGPADFYITTTDMSDKLAEQLKDFRPEYFGARPNVLLILWTPQPAATNTSVLPPPAQP